MSEDQTPENMTHAGVIIGSVVALVGITAAIAIYRQPELLKVPLWLALIACFCFVLSGIALSLKSTHYTGLYQWSVVLLLLCMGFIPAWLSMGTGSSSCTASISLIGGRLMCRLAFGVATAFMLPVLIMAIKQALRRSVV